MAKKLIVLLAVLLFSCDKKDDPQPAATDPGPTMVNKNMTFELYGMGSTTSMTLNLDWNGDGTTDTTMIGNALKAKRTVNTRYIKAKWAAENNDLKYAKFWVWVKQDSTKTIYSDNQYGGLSITLDLYQ